jgi:hypothetical protein
VSEHNVGNFQKYLSIILTVIICSELEQEGQRKVIVKEDRINKGEEEVDGEKGKTRERTGGPIM